MCRPTRIPGADAGASEQSSHRPGPPEHRTCGHHDEESCAVGTGDEPLVAVDLPPAGRLLRARRQRRRVGSPPGAGSVIANADRTSPRARRARNSLLRRGSRRARADAHCPRLGAAMFSAVGPNSEYPAASNTGDRSLMFRPRPPRTHDDGRVRRQQTPPLRLRLHLDPDRVAAGRGRCHHRARPRPAAHVPHEFPRPFDEAQHLGWIGQVDSHVETSSARTDRSIAR